MNRHSIRGRSFGVVAAIVLTSIAGAGVAEARDGDVVVRGTCTGSSVDKLKLAPRDGRIETEFEVDSNRNGQVWNVVLTDNGVRVWSGQATTVAPSGSFTVRRLLADRAGSDLIRARATNTTTGEVCRASATV